MKGKCRYTRNTHTLSHTQSHSHMYAFTALRAAPFYSVSLVVEDEELLVSVFGGKEMTDFLGQDGENENVTN